MEDLAGNVLLELQKLNEKYLRELESQLRRLDVKEKHNDYYGKRSLVKNKSKEYCCLNGISVNSLPRKSKTDYYLDIAKAVSERSTCLRRRYGAVIVKDDEIISTGYNGSPRGEVNCCDVGKCQRMENKIPHGERYELCHSVHAEQNAIISASRRDMLGATLYLVGFEGDREIAAEPCDICKRLIVNAGIVKVVNRSL